MEEHGDGRGVNNGRGSTNDGKAGPNDGKAGPNDGKGLNGIRQIVRLKELLNKWHSTALKSRTNNNHNDHQHHHHNNHHHQDGSGGIAPVVNKRLRNTVMCDSDEEGCQSPEPPFDVPKGHMAVYVGEELRRFIIPMTYLRHHLFNVLLEKAKEEYGYDHGGAITFPCEIETFKYLLKCIETENREKGEHSDDNPDDTVEDSSCNED